MFAGPRWRFAEGSEASPIRWIADLPTAHPRGITSRVRHSRRYPEGSTRVGGCEEGNTPCACSGQEGDAACEGSRGRIRNAACMFVGVCIHCIFAEHTINLQTPPMASGWIRRHEAGRRASPPWVCAPWSPPGRQGPNCTRGEVRRCMVLCMY